MELSFTWLVETLGMFCGLVVIILGGALSHLSSSPSDPWFRTGRKIALLGGVLMVVCVILLGIDS